MEWVILLALCAATGALISQLYTLLRQWPNEAYDQSGSSLVIVAALILIASLFPAAGAFRLQAARRSPLEFITLTMLTGLLGWWLTRWKR